MCGPWRVARELDGQCGGNSDGENFFDYTLPMHRFFADSSASHTQTFSSLGGATTTLAPPGCSTGYKSDLLQM